MRTIFYASLLALLFTSCLVVKVYQSPKPSLENKPLTVHRSMIGSGEMVDLGGELPHEILFFSEEKAPKAVFFQSEMVASDSLDSKNIWVQKNPKKSIFIVTDSIAPLVVIDGQIRKEKNLMNSLHPDSIESINVLKGESALENYGEEGKNGVIEITLKKN